MLMNTAAPIARSRSAHESGTVPLVLELANTSLTLEPVVLWPGKYVIGSLAGCHVRLDWPGVQPQHCLILSTAKRMVLKAWDSRTWINDCPVREALLREGDRVVVGPVEFLVRKAQPLELLPSEMPAEPFAAAPLPPRPLVVEPPRATGLRFDQGVSPSPPALRALAQALQEVAAAGMTPAWPSELAAESPRPSTDQAPPAPSSVATPDVTERVASDEVLRLKGELEQEQQVVQAEIARHEQALAALEQERRAASAVAAARREELHQAEESVHERQALVAAQGADLARQAERLRQQAAELREKDRELSNNTADLAYRTQQLAAREAARAAEQQTAAAELEIARHAWDERRTAEIESLTRQEQLLRRGFDDLAQRQAQIDGARASLDQEWAAYHQDRGALGRERAASAELRQQLQAGQADLQHEQERWQSLRQALAEDQTRLTAAQQELHAARQALAAERERLALDHQRTVAEQHELAGEHEALAAERRRLDSERQSLQNAREQLQAQQQELAAAQAHLEAQSAALQAGWEMLATQQKQHQEASARLAECDAKSAGQSAALEAGLQELAKRQQVLDAELARFDAERANWITSQQAQVESQNRVWVDRQTELEHERARLATEAARLAAESSRLAANQGELSAREERSHADDLAVEVEQSQLEAQYADLRAREAALEAEREALASERDAWEQARAEAAAQVHEQPHAESQDRDWADRQTELEHEKARLATEAAHLAAESSRLAAYQDELTAREERSHADHSAAESAQCELEAQYADLRTREAALEADREVLASERDAWEQARAEAAARAHEIDAASNSQETARCELEEREREIAAAEASLNAARNEIAAEQDRCRLVREELDELSAQLSAEALVLQADREQLETLQAQFQAEHSQAQAAGEQLDSERAKFAAAEAALEAERARIATVSAELEAARAAVSELQSHLLSAEARESEQAQRWEAERREMDDAEAVLLSARERLETERTEFHAQCMEREVSLAEQHFEQQALTAEPPNAQPFVAIQETLEAEEDVAQGSGSIVAEVDAPALSPESSSELTQPARSLATEPDRFPGMVTLAANLPELLGANFGSGTNASEADPLVPKPAGASAEEFDLRLTLAQMFAMPIAPLPAEPALDESLASPSEPTAGPLNAALQFSPVEPTPIQERRPQAESERLPEPAAQISSRSVASPAPTPAVEEEVDSVEAYMERLLARNRRNSNGEGPSVSTPASSQSTGPAETVVSQQPEAKPEPAATPNEPTPEPQDAAVAEAARVVEAAALTASKTRARQQSDELRAGLNSLRQVANLSARSAIATYNWKRLRTRIAIKSALTAISLILAPILFLGKMWGASAFPRLGWACLALGLVTGADLLWACLWLRRLGAAGRGAAHATPASPVPNSAANAPQAAPSDDSHVEGENSKSKFSCSM